MNSWLGLVVELVIAAAIIYLSNKEDFKTMYAYDKVDRMHKKGYTASYIAKKTKLPESTVRGWIYGKK